MFGNTCTYSLILYLKVSKHGCIIVHFLDEGVVYAFGSDYYGCLGCEGQEGDEAYFPITVDFFHSNPVDQISCGDAHVVALTKDGEVYTWGCGEFGKPATVLSDEFFTMINLLLTCNFLSWPEIYYI